MSSFTYTNASEMWSDAVFICLDTGRYLESRVGGCYEVLSYKATLLYPDSNFVLCRRRRVSPIYANAELLWYLSRDASAEMIMHYAPQYKNFVESDGKAYGSYGDRIANAAGAADQLDLLIEHLKKMPHSRQAIVTMWQAKDLYVATREPKNDVPCTLSLQFFLRDGQLYLTTTMRSNDLWLGFPYDVFCFTTIQCLIAEELGVKVGTYCHQVGSLHLYTKNEKAARERDILPGAGEYRHRYEIDKGLTYLDEVLDIERKYRRSGMIASQPYFGPLGDAASCVTQHRKGHVSPLIQKAQEIFDADR